MVPERVNPGGSNQPQRGDALPGSFSPQDEPDSQGV